MSDFFIASKARISRLFDYAVQDQFCASIVYDLIDYGHDVRFSIFGGAGAYKPYALRTELLDTPEKLELFNQHLSLKFGTGEMSARIDISRFANEGAALHSFLHELMHFYQDMHGLFFMPLEEEGVFPIILDAKSSILATLFNEAWAEVEAIRAVYSIALKGRKSLWNSVLIHSDFGYMARRYEKDMASGIDEGRAAAKMFMRWYEGKHRVFYEQHAFSIYQLNLSRYMTYAKHDEARLRSLDLPMLVARLPEGAVPKYFNHFDWISEVFQPEISTGKQPLAENNDVQNIKCGAPPYLWNRLRNAQAAQSDIFAPPSD